MLVVTGVVISEGLLLFTTSPPHTVSCHYERILNYIAKIYIFFDISKYLGYYFVSGRQKKRETLASVLPPGSGKKIDRTTAFGVELNQSMSFKIGSLTPLVGCRSNYNWLASHWISFEYIEKKPIVKSNC